MPRRVRPPVETDEHAVLDVAVGAGVALGELSVHGRNRGALALYESAGMRTVWQAERWEKALGSG
jgi:ribosomal protein S18 acetylase RimI-like enzyme